MTETLKTTPLNAAHRKLGAKMVPFGGWDMPVQYSGIIDEHQAVRTKAGLFDVSHMGEIEVEGPGAEALLQKLTCNDVSKLAAGRAHYTGLLNERGTFLDDILVYKRGAEKFLLVVNAGNSDKDWAWIEKHAKTAGVKAENRSPHWGQIALQGPESLAILSPLTDVPLAPMKYYGFGEGKVAGHTALVSRTGYTGEDGFEIYCPAEVTEKIWNLLLDKGGPRGLKPAGLGARDTLRLEAAMCLYGHDIDETRTPVEADLNWIVKPQKGDFFGRDVLVKQQAEGTAQILVAFKMIDRGIPRQDYPVLKNGAPIGKVTSGTHAPFLNFPVGMAYVAKAHSAIGTEFEVDLRGRAAKAVVVPKPFYKRAK
jgi:aminomethyltransferase